MLLPNIESILSQANISRSDLDGIAYGRGPGSFAGIRIAAAVTQGLCLAQNLPVFGFSSLQALALSSAIQYKQLKESRTAIFTMVNAHMGEVFWAGFTYQSDSLQCTTAEHIGDLDKAISACENFSKANENTVVVGDAIKLPNFKESDLSSLSLLSDVVIDLSGMTDEVSAQFEQNNFGDFTAHQPVYLRDSVSWKKLDEQPKLLQPNKSQ